ncbi:MAG: trimeric intracellular cation channel family protein, partial [Notoacmeibacter sp.]
IIWCDALGLALFSVTGAKLALNSGAAPVVSCAMGVITATFGGIIRDVLSAEVPLILRREIYATASLLGAAVFVILAALELPVELALAGGFIAAFALRGFAIVNGWSLPGRFNP